MLTKATYKNAATYWAPLPQDGWGNKAFNAPVTLFTRWENRQERFLDIAGEEKVSRAIIWLPQDVLISGYLFKGTSVALDPTEVDEAYEIRQIFEIPDLRNLFIERRVFL